MAERKARLAEKQRAVNAREALVIKATQEAMNAEAEESLRAETAKALFLKIQDELLEVVVAREESKRAEEKRLEANREEAKKSEAKRLEEERLAEQRKIQEERVARELAEKAELETLKKAEIEAKKAEAAEEAQIIYDPRVDGLEQSIEEIKADQKEFKEALKQQAESQNETKNILAMIWDKINKQA